MRHLKIHTGTSNNEQALLLFDDTSGVLIAFYYLTKKQIFVEYKGIWIVDLNAVYSQENTADSISCLVKNICRN